MRCSQMWNCNPIWFPWQIGNWHSCFFGQNSKTLCLVVPVSSGDTERMSLLHQVLVHHWILQRQRWLKSQFTMYVMDYTLLVFEFELSSGNLRPIKTHSKIFLKHSLLFQHGEIKHSTLPLRHSNFKPTNVFSQELRNLGKTKIC